MSGFISSRHNLNIIRYADETALKVDLGVKLKELLDNVVDEFKKKKRKEELNVNYKKTDCEIYSKKTNPRYGLFTACLLRT